MFPNHQKRLSFTVTNDLTYDQRMQRICTALSEAGYIVTLIGRELPNSQPLQSFLFQQKRLHCYFQKGKFFYLEYNIRLFFYLLSQKNDAFCAIDLDTILPNVWAAKLRSKPFVYDAHEYFSEVPEVVARPFIKKIWETIADYAIPKAAVCYTVGEGLAAVLAARYRKPFGVVRNVPFYIDKKNIATAKKTKTKILLYQGALNDGRGLEELLAAMPLLRNAELWLAGEGDNSTSLRHLALELGLENKVRFLGYVLPQDLKNITAQADIGCNLLQNKGLNYYYSLANKFFDYIQADIPSINPAFPEYLALLKQHETGIVVADLSPETLASAIQNLIDNTEYYTTLQHNCATAATVFCWEKEREILLDLWEKV
jgi:glycosyltransferase involved in cell wall biosynthesis